MLTTNADHRSARVSSPRATYQGARHFEDLQAHRFFSGVAWGGHLATPPPFVPTLSSEADDSFFTDHEERRPSFGFDSRDNSLTCASSIASIGTLPSEPSYLLTYLLTYLTYVLNVRTYLLTYLLTYLRCLQSPRTPRPMPTARLTGPGAVAGLTGPGAVARLTGPGAVAERAARPALPLGRRRTRRHSRQGQRRQTAEPAMAS